MKHAGKEKRQKLKRLPIEDVKEEVIELAFRVRATASQLEGLKNYLKSNNIEFGPVK